MNSGKTSLFYRLKYNEIKETYTSMKVIEDEIIIKNKRYKIIDIPGYSSIRKNKMNEYLKESKYILFLIDSFEIMSNLNETCSFLEEMIEESNKIIIILNKIEMSLYNKEQIKNQIEKELLKRNIHQIFKYYELSKEKSLNEILKEIK